MSSRAPSVARATHDQWLEIRAQANSRLRSGRGDGSDAFALARIVRRALGDIGRGDWSDVGIRVSQREFDGSGMLRRTEWPIEVVVSKQDDDRRRRFTVAHELGHYLLRGAERLVAPSTIELFCDAFASELLVPQSRLDALRTADGELPTAEELLRLANRLKVNLSPVIRKIPLFATPRPSFVLVASPSSISGALKVDVSSGTGGIGGVPEHRTLAKVGTWGSRLDGTLERRISGIDHVETRFVLPPSIPPRDQANYQEGARSGVIAGTVRWNTYRLNNGRLVLTATFVQVDLLRLSDPAPDRQSRHRG